MLPARGGVEMKVVLRFVISREFQTSDPTLYESYVASSLSFDQIRRIMRYPEDEFCELTGCHSWQPPLNHRSH
jgi:hypothetical protein